MHSNRAIAVRLSFYYSAIFLVFGVYMPFFPAWLNGRGFGAAEIGLLLAVGTWSKVVASPAIAVVADRLGERRRPMLFLAAASVMTFALFTMVDALWSALVVSALLGLTLPPMMPLGENLTMTLSRKRGLDYGRIRLWGSLTFIAASYGGGLWLAGRADDVILLLILGFMALTVVACGLLPDVRFPRAPRRHGSIWRLLRNPMFLVFLLAASMVQASHAAYYGFSTIHWAHLGLSKDVIGLLWAEGVAAEVILFAFAAKLVGRLGVSGLLGVAAVAGMVRWTVTAGAEDVAALAVVQILHAFTFAATHLAALNFIQTAVPEDMAATGQALYSSIAMGAVLALVMAGTGELYAAFAGGAFLAMTAMCGVGLAATVALSRLWRGDELKLAGS